MDLSNLFDLTGKTALVTGSSEGLGLAMARGLAAAGARLILNGRDEQKLANAAKSFADAGHRIETRPFDVADEGAVIAAFEHFDAAGVEIDILFNNAGIQFRKPMVDLKTDEWRRVVEIHLTGAFQVGREAAKRMIARGRGGKIVNIASLASEVARATIAPYVAAKGGVRMLTRSNRALLDDPKFDAWVKGRTPSGRWGKPDDLIGVTVFLASAASDYVNGQVIYVDGGLLAVI
jgi:gluconate 5-dehydrogenase